MNVNQIVAQYLKAHGYDGLCTDECGCKADDLMPCGYGGDACVAGHLAKVPEGVDAEFWISPGKAGELGKER